MKLNIYKILLSWKTQPVLFLSQSNQAAFITIFLITFVGVLIFLSWILRRYDKNKKIIVQAKKQLREVQQVKDQI